MNVFLIALLAAGVSSPAAAPSPVPSTSSAALVQEQRAEVDPFVAVYREAAEAGDSERLAEHWRSAPGRVLGTIDQDLEGSLALVEKLREAGDEAEGMDTERERIKALRERAIFGAQVAASAIDMPLLADYVVSFAGWNREQQLRFREGQKSYGEARAAQDAGDLERALGLAQRTTELAEPLGDWWGTAVGRSLTARLALETGDHGLAQLEAARARSIHRSIGLFGAEARDLLTLGEASLALGQRGRAAQAARAGLELSPEGSRQHPAFEDLLKRAEAAE